MAKKQNIPEGAYSIPDGVIKKAAEEQVQFLEGLKAALPMFEQALGPDGPKLVQMMMENADRDLPGYRRIAKDGARSKPEDQKLPLVIR